MARVFKKVGAFVGTADQEPVFRFVEVEGGRLAVGHEGVGGASQAAKHVGARRVEWRVMVELVGERVECLGRVIERQHGNGDRSIEGDDRRWFEHGELVVQGDDAAPVGVRPGRGANVAGDDHGLQRERSGRGEAKRSLDRR